MVLYESSEDRPNVCYTAFTRRGLCMAKMGWLVQKKGGIANITVLPPPYEGNLSEKLPLRKLCDRYDSTSRHIGSAELPL